MNFRKSFSEPPELEEQVFCPLGQVAACRFELGNALSLAAGQSENLVEVFRDKDGGGEPLVQKLVGTAGHLAVEISGTGIERFSLLAGKFSGKERSAFDLALDDDGASGKPADNLVPGDKASFETGKVPFVFADEGAAFF